MNKVEEFNDDAGADIGELTGSANLSFEDIKHIRNEGGIYNSNSNLDTAPIIPTLGTFGRQVPISSNSKLNNVQYRKQMNQQKKMALLNGARANSLATGGNPMQQGPRANSLATVGNPMQQGPRANSLATGFNPMYDGSRANSMAASFSAMPADQRYPFAQQQMMPDPRSMSMTSQRGNPMRPRPQEQFPMRQQQFPPQNPQQFDQSGRSMSLMSGGGIYGQNYPRTKSLGGSRPFVGGPPQGYQGPPLRSKNLVSSAQLQQPQGPLQFNNQYPSQPQFYQDQNFRANGRSDPAVGGPVGPENQMRSGPSGPYQRQPPNAQFSQQQPLQFENEQQFENGYTQSFQPKTAPSSNVGYDRMQQHSLEELGEVREEEEGNHNDEEDEDVIYKFDKEESKGIDLSRKSTLKKNNSMKIRKLDLFNDGGRNAQQDQGESQSSTPEETTDKSPSIAPSTRSDSPDLNELQPSNSHSTLLGNRKPSEQHSLRSIRDNTAFSNFRNPSADTNPQLSNTQLVQTASPSSFYEASDSPMGNNFDSESEFHGARQNVHGSNTPPTAPTSQVSHSADGKFDNYSNITEPIQDISEKESKGIYSPVQDNTTHKETRPFDNNYEQTNQAERGGSSNSVPRTFSSASHSSQSSKKEKRSSFSGRNFLKRLSRSKRSSVAEPERDLNSHQRTPSSNTIVSSIGDRSMQQKPLPFTKEEMHIMNCNTELLDELESITRELASSIKRELSLETRLKNHTVYSRSPGGEPDNLESVVIEKSKAIVELQEKLNKEKRLRFISEEHALLQEQGQSPSPLKLEYEKTEIYNQLVAKNDLVNQLQNRISELESQDQLDLNAMDSNLIEKIQILQAENEDLLSQNYSQQEEIKILESQRDELREVIGKLTSQNNQDTKLLNDKIKALELKCQNLKGVNDRLTNREGNSSTSNGPSFGFNRFGSRGKLNGFTIVSPNESRFLDDR
ncbi:hypothetical protein KGF57_002608 [Candida theae]|uniref:Uncharacterized protein n=1 Tax=Candida theae TaxID=1198502 RepID=A0AAD5BFH2_9ASCO|nr:uncharacterized protein KGF57_002608 [Candida theae]KAI5958253.1 hypothetical protein KGF57_002608 [Candida theae]